MLVWCDSKGPWEVEAQDAAWRSTGTRSQEMGHVLGTGDPTSSDPYFLQYVSASLVLGSPELDPSPMCLTGAEQRGRITCLDLLATVLLLQPRTLLI